MQDVVEKEFYRPREVMEIFGICRNTFNKWLKADVFKGVVFINTRCYIPVKEVERVKNNGMN